MKVAVFFLLIAAVLVSAQNQNTIMIDDFIFDTPPIFIQIPSNPSFPIVAPSNPSAGSTQDSSILGGERDIQLTVTSGDSNLVVSTAVAQGEFNCATPNGARGNCLLQYDGVDGSINLVDNGLGNQDFTIQNSFAIRTEIESDLPTTIDFRVISPNGDRCVETVNIPGDDTVNEYILRYDSFDTRNCDFSNVGAMEVFVNMADNVDVIIKFISVYGPIPTTPTPTRTPTPIPSVTRTPTPTPSDTCVCRCPIFTCEVFRVDDGNYYFYNSFFANFFVQFFDPGYYVTFFTNYFVNPYYYTAFFQPTFFTPVFFDYYYFFTTPVFFDYYFFNFFFDLWYGLFSF